ncbi:hypothetical protein D3C72_2093520 [compost metagenome]
MMDGDLVTTFDDLKVNGQRLVRTWPTLCEELLMAEQAYPDQVELTFDRVTEKMLVQNYQSNSGRQKSLNVYWISTRPFKIILNLKDQNIFTCAEQVKSALSR